jgi:hypothetical protein
MYLYGRSVQGTSKWGSFAGGPEVYERKAMGTGISFHGDSVGHAGVGSSTGHLGRWLKGVLEVERLTLCGSSVKGTWREGSLAGDTEGHVEKDLETGFSSNRGPIGEPARGLVYRGLREKHERGSRNGASHSEGAQRKHLERGLLYWAPWKIC